MAFPQRLRFYILTKQVFVQCLLYTVYLVRDILLCTLKDVTDTERFENGQMK